MVCGGAHWCPKFEICFCGLFHIQLLIKQKRKDPKRVYLVYQL